MLGIQLNNGFLDMSDIEFKCPYCYLIYNDNMDKYLNRCNKNKSGYTKIKCSCGKKFGVTYNMMGDMVGFKL